MATVNKFEDLEVWQMARKYARSIYELTLKEKFAKEYKFKDQIKDSSGSVMDNIAEGFGRGSRLEFIQFLSIAKGSADEVKSQLYRILDYQLITEEAFKKYYKQANTIGAKIYSFMKYLNKTEHKGTKFKNRS